MNELPRAFRGGERLRAEPVAERHASSFGGGDQGGVFVVGSTEPFDVASRVVAGRSSGAGHDARIAATKSIDNVDLCGHNKYMNTTRSAHITWVRIGSGRVVHILAEYGTAARSVSKCGKTGKVTLIPDVGGRPVCDRCMNIRRRG